MYHSDNEGAPRSCSDNFVVRKLTRISRSGPRMDRDSSTPSFLCPKPGLQIDVNIETWRSWREPQCAIKAEFVNLEATGTWSCGNALGGVELGGLPWDIHAKGDTLGGYRALRSATGSSGSGDGRR